MRAVLVRSFGGPEVCKVEQVPIPKIGENEVLVKVRYAGVNPVDTYIRSGTYARKPELPYTPGGDCSGVVEEVGLKVTNIKAGDAVISPRSITGACAEYCVVNKDFVFPLHSGQLDFKQGAGIGTPFFTAYRALFTRGQAEAGQSILIHGASGGVGTLCVQIAKNIGMSVHATAGSEEGMKIVKDCGADFVYNHRQTGYFNEILNNCSSGVNLIIEMLANVNLQNDLQLLSVNGRVVVVGNRGQIEINPRLLMMKESIVTGCMLFNTTPHDWLEMREALKKYQEMKWFKPIVASEYTLENVGQAHHDVISGRGATGNLVIEIG